MGCFWGAERKFWQAPGVWTTAVGYAGGHTPNPTYEEVCSGTTGHTEVVRVVFDPARVAYDALLKIFWESHDPTQGMRQGNDVGTQYRSAIYWYGEEQRKAAEASRERVRARARAGGLRPDHHRDPRGAEVLLRRGLPPAVPAQEPGRLLRPRRHGRVLLLIRRLPLAALALSCAATPPASGGDVWRIEIDSSAAGAPLSRALLGHYDLSGVLVTRDAAGKLRALFVNLSDHKRKAKLEIDGEKRPPSAVLVFDDPTAGIVNAKPRKTLVLPPRSIVVAEY